MLLFECVCNQFVCVTHVCTYNKHTQTRTHTHTSPSPEGEDEMHTGLHSSLLLGLVQALSTVLADFVGDALGLTLSKTFWNHDPALAQPSSGLAVPTFEVDFGDARFVDSDNNSL